MTQRKDKTKKFKSISTGQLCDEAKYAAELVCIRKNEKKNEGSLEYKFWSKSQKDNYQVQVRCARKLIKKFGDLVLVKYLNSSYGKNLYSLGFLHKSKKFVLCLDFVEEGLSKFSQTVKKDQDSDKNTIELPDEKTFKKNNRQSKKTLFSKIKGAESGKEKK